MADYAKYELTATYSENSDYSTPLFKRTFPTMTNTPTELKTLKVSCVTSSGTTIELTDLFTGGTRAMLIVANRDATNYVTLVVRSLGNAVSDSVRIYPGELYVNSAMDPAYDLVITADTSACICEVLVEQ